MVEGLKRVQMVEGRRMLAMDELDGSRDDEHLGLYIQSKAAVARRTWRVGLGRWPGPFPRVSEVAARYDGWSRRSHEPVEQTHLDLYLSYVSQAGIQVLGLSMPNTAMEVDPCTWAVHGRA